MAVRRVNSVLIALSCWIKAVLRGLWSLATWAVRNWETKMRLSSDAG